MSGTYEPGEDSLFLSDVVSRIRSERVAEIGVGSGFVLRHYSEIDSPDLAVGTDRDLEALNVAIGNDRTGLCEYVLCNSCDCMRESSLKLIFFNPPYLRDEGDGDVAASGGERGIETTFEMAMSAFRALTEGGEMVFLGSSLSDLDTLSQRLTEAGLEIRKLGVLKLFFEELTAFRAVRGPLNRRFR